MTKKPAFSLMEVMVILLIMAVTLAATAPMISKKMSRNVGTAEEPWKFTGSNESISFNGNGRDNLTVFIGTDRLSRRVFNNLITAVNSAPLYLRSLQQIPHISLASETFGRWDRGAGGNGRYYNDVSGQAQNHIGSRLVGYLGFVADDANNYGINNIPAEVGNFPNSISLPYLSSKLPWDANGNVQRGIVFGNRLGFRGNTLDPTLAGVDAGGGTFEDIIQDKIVIGHDSQIMSRIGGNTEDLRDIILIGSDAGIRGSFNTIVGRGIGFTHANRAIVRNTVFINSRRPGLPRFNNNNQFMANDVFYCVLFSGPDENDNESNDFANNNNVAPINRVNNIEGISAITGIGRGLFTSGSGHTLIGNMAHCGHDTPVIIGNNGFHGLISSFNSVALGSEVIAAGSNCVAIGAGIVAGFPRVNDRVTPEVNDPNRPGRYNTVAIGSNGNPNTFNVNAGNAVALGTNPSIHEGPNAGAVHPEFGISIGTDSEVNRPSGISIGQQAVAEGNAGIAIGSNDTNPTYVLGDNSIAIGSAARVIRPNGQRANNAIAIGAGITANENEIRFFGNNNTTFRFEGNSVIFPGDNNQAKATIRRVCQPGCDIRLKNVGEKLASGLEDIKKLEFFNFTYKKDKEKKPHVGVMAQDLQKVFPTSVSEGSDGYLRIRRDEMFYAALNAIKELDAKIIALASELKSFFERVDKLVEKSNFGVQIARNQASLDNLKSENADIEARLARLEEE